MMVANMHVPEGELSAFCRRSGIKRLSLFGSVLTERFSDASDVDVLVEFERGRQVGYLRMAAMERELSKLFGDRKIDLRTPGELSKYFRDEVMRTAAVQYAKQ
jgi:predicted nucleotidyltransferase